MTLKPNQALYASHGIRIMSQLFFCQPKTVCCSCYEQCAVFAVGSNQLKLKTSNIEIQKGPMPLSTCGLTLCWNRAQGPAISGQQKNMYFCVHFINQSISINLYFKTLIVYFNI